MDQFVLFNFSVQKNDRVYRVVLQPGSPWEDVHAVLDEFKEHFKTLEEEAKKKEAESAQVATEVAAEPV